MDSNFAVNDRISIKNDLATIRFIGQIPQWKNTTALGIEWDSPDKGKNDGSLCGKQYFTTSHDQNGSFIKVNNSNIDPRNSFVASLIQNYGEDYQLHEISLGSKFTQSYGFDKLNSITSNFPKLSSISLEKKCIYTAGSFDSLVLSKLHHLDISFNLFTDFAEILTILDKCPNLNQLNLNGNRLSSIGVIPRSFPLKVLKLSSSFIPIESLNLILSAFPKLQELYLAGNDYSDSDISDLVIGNNPDLKLIDLSFNKLHQIPSINVAQMNLLNNAIKVLELKCSPKSLDLRYNSIADWEEIDKLADLDLNELRINGNPVFEHITIDEQTIYLIARLSFYGKLNGSWLSKDEITNGELYFISQVQKQKIQYSRGSRWFRLLQKYGIEDKAIDTLSNKNNLRKKKLQLNIVYDEKMLSRTFLIDNTILRVKGIVCRRWDLSILDINLFYYIDEIRIDLKDDISVLDKYGFSQNQAIYVETI